jgi:hypothetical protein
VCNQPTEGTEVKTVNVYFYHETLSTQCADGLEGDTPSDAGLSLVAQLMEASLTETFRVGNQVRERYRQQAEDALAELDAVRAGVRDLLQGPWMPTSAAILAELWPSPNRIDQFRGHPRGEQPLAA